MDKSTTVLIIVTVLLLACYLNNETKFKNSSRKWIIYGKNIKKRYDRRFYRRNER